ncbi:MAG: tetratricopeptide repeat protein [Caldilineaceae bacterium]
MFCRMSDYAAARPLYESCLQIAQELGYHWGEGETLAELGDTLTKLGEYTLADEYLHRAERQLAQYGYLLEETHCYLLHARLHYYLGAYTTARQWLRRVFQAPFLQDSTWLKMVAQLTRATLAYQTEDFGAVVEDATAAKHLGERLKTPLLQAEGLLLLGHAHLALQQWMVAARAYAQAATIYQALTNVVNGAEAVAGLALVTLATDGAQSAFTQLEAILPRLQDQRNVGWYEPFFVYLAAYRILAAVGDPRAATILTTGHARLLCYADQIKDAAHRQSFMTAVPVHRELQQTYQALQPTA